MHLCMHNMHPRTGFPHAKLPVMEFDQIIREVTTDYIDGLKEEQKLCPIDGVTLLWHPTRKTWYCPDYKYHAAGI